MNDESSATAPMVEHEHEFTVLTGHENDEPEVAACTGCGRQWTITPRVWDEPAEGEGGVTFRRARSLLGRQVKVTLVREGDGGAIVARGRLLRVGDSGELVVEDDMGFCHFCWPMLDIDERPADDAPTPAPVHSAQAVGRQYMSNACIHDKHEVCDEECAYCHDGCACGCHPWNGGGGYEEPAMEEIENDGDGDG